MKKQTLQEKLAERKYKIPSKFWYFWYHFIMTKLVAPKYRPHITVKDSLSDCEGGCFLIWNHQSRLDHAFLMQAAYPRPISILAGYSEFFRSHLHTVFKIMNIIPKKVFTNDIAGIRGINSIIRQGGCVCMSPEGMSSIYGHNQPIVVGTGRFLQFYRKPVYIMHLKGSYLTSTKICLDERYGRVEGELSLLFTPEQLEQMTPQEIEDRINEEFRFDDYDWQEEQQIRWKHKKGMCRDLDTVLYKCPRCGSEMTMKATEESIRCTACGNGATVNDYYAFVPFDAQCVIPKSPSKWVDWQREEMIRSIRADKNYSFSATGTLGYLPPYQYVRKPATSTPCGTGTFTVDHGGLHFRGTKLGEEWSCDLSYEQVFSLVVMTDTTHFGFYVDEEYYEFLPDTPCVGRFLLATEEMHRLHVNTWKALPWFRYMYEGLEE